MCVQGNGTGVGQLLLLMRIFFFCSFPNLAGISLISGLGLDPVGPFSAIVTDLCPECVAGDLDLAQGLDGRWKIEW